MSAIKGRDKSLVRNLLFTLSVVTSVVIIYTLMTSSFAAYKLIFSVRGLLAFLLIQVGWLISAIRLKAIVASTGKDLPFWDAVKARYLGGLLANITPTSLGGEPARALYIKSACGIDFATSYSLALYEVYYDVIITSLGGLFFSIYYLPHSFLITIISSFTFVSWFGLAQLARRFPILARLERGASRFLGSRILGFLRSVEKGFTNAWNQEDLGDKLMIAFLSLLIHVTWATSMSLIAWDFSPSSMFSYTASYFMMQVASMIPTPGGSGAAEYGLSLAVRPEIAIGYRVVYYYSAILMGLAAMMGVGKLEKEGENPIDNEGGNVGNG